MKLAEAIEIIESQAANHRAAAYAPKEPVTKLKEWTKTITALDKSVSTGYSLVGEFCEKSKDLEPGLFLIFTLFSGQRTENKQVFDRGIDGEFLTDEEGNLIRKEKIFPEYFEERRALLFDFDGSQAKLEHFAWLPRNRWAKKLWSPVEDWLEIQPNIQNKIEFWEREVNLRTNALAQAQQRLDALKQQIATDTEELDPQTKTWLQTGAVLGTKKAATAEATFEKTFKTFY
jgi:hypothetical protein